MDRLTRYEDGIARKVCHYPQNLKDSELPCFNCKDDYRCNLDILSKLAAYEDTGLSPQEIHRGFDRGRYICVGDKVYVVARRTKQEPYRVIPCLCTKAGWAGKVWYTMKCIEYTDWYYVGRFLSAAFGKKVFKAEAQAINAANRLNLRRKYNEQR